MKSNNKITWLVIILFVILVIVVSIIKFESDFESWQKFGIILIALTLLFLIKYVIDTDRMAVSAQKQLDYLERPNLFINLGQLGPYDLDNIPTLDNIVTSVDVRNSSKFNIEAVISVVFKYGPEHLVRHSDPYYSGKIIWNISANQMGQTNFNLDDILNDIDVDATTFLECVRDRKLDNRFDVAVFSKIRRYKSNDVFSENIAQFYYLDAGYHNQYVELKIPVWVWEPKAPPKEMEEKAFDGENV